MEVITIDSSSDDDDEKEATSFAAAAASSGGQKKRDDETNDSAAKKQTTSSTSNQNKEVIALLDDSSDENNDTNDNPVPKMDRKRKAAASSATSSYRSINIEDEIMEMESSSSVLPMSRKRSARRSIATKSNNNDNAPIIPFHLFETTSSKSLLQNNHGKYFQSLRQAIGLDAPNKRQIQFLIISNFLIDFQYLYQKLPDIIHIPKVIIFYGSLFGGHDVQYIQIQQVIMKNWMMAAEYYGNSVEFVRLIPSDPPRSMTNPLNVKIEYGCHHTKMFLTGFTNDEIVGGGGGGARRQSMIRVCIHTANLGESDVELKTNGFYAQNFPLKKNLQQHHQQQRTVVVNPYMKVNSKSGSGSSAPSATATTTTRSTCSFENDLADYLESYGYSKRQSWSSPTLGGSSGNNNSSSDIREARLKRFGHFSEQSATQSTATAAPSSYPIIQTANNDTSSSRLLTSQDLSLSELIRQYDYSSAYATLIPSTPGYHKGIDMNKYGYLKLRKEIIDAFPSRQTKKGGKTKPPLICQISSMGSLSEKWLRQFCSALDYTSTHYSNPIDNDNNAAVASDKKPLESIAKIIWPTVDEIRRSVEGFLGGGSVPGRKTNLEKTFLKPLYHRWSKRSGVDPLFTARHVPHIKTVVQPSSSSSSSTDNKNRSIEWMVLTSHNLSTAAWGQVRNNQRSGGKEYFVRHWEMGVFFAPATLLEACGMTKPVRILSIGYGRDNNGTISLCNDDDDGEEEDEGGSDYVDVYVPLPYDVLRPDAYDGRDNYWVVDPPPSSSEPDDFGRYGY